MVTQNNNSHNQSASRNAKNVRPKFPTLADCKRLSNGRNAEATVLQKICHYYSKAAFEIDGHLFTAPTTEMLQRELGFARSTINKSLRSLEDRFIIQIKQRRWNRSPRRYIRVVIDPATYVGDLPTNSGGTKSVGADDELKALSSSDSRTVHIEKKKKKKIQKKTQPIQGKPSSTLEATPLYDPPKQSQDEFCKALAKQIENAEATTTAAPKGELWQPRGLFEHQELDNFKQQAKTHSYKVIDVLAARRGWDMQDKINWQHALLTRWEREFRRGRASGKTPPAKVGLLRPKYF